jgi:hypothetical protein
VDFGVGYLFNMNHSELNRFTLTVSPDSSLDYRFIIGEVKFSLYDRLGTTGGYGTLPRNDLTGDGSTASVDFQRLFNSAGLSAAWAATQKTTVSAGYDYNIDRGISDSFGQFDHDTHTLNAALFNRVSVRWTVGVAGSVYINQFSQNFQNGSRGYGAGPTLQWQPTRYLNFSGSVRYQISDSDRGAANGDTSGFAGITYNASVAHTINRHLSHGLSVGRNADLGLGSNFNDTFTVGYHLGWSFYKNLGLNFGASYNSIAQSGAGYDFVLVPAGTVIPAGTVLADGTVLKMPVVFGRDVVLPLRRQGETSDTIQLTVGTGFEISRHMSAGISYGHYFRTSNLAGHDYHQNTVTLTLSYRF